MLCEINGMEITVLVNKEIASCTNVDDNPPISTVALSENKVLIGYTTGYRTNGNVTTWMLACEITENDIILGTPTNFSAYQGECSNIVMEALSENKVFMACNGYNASTHLYGCVITLEGLNISFGTAVGLASHTYAGKAISIAVLSENKVIIAHMSDNTCRLNAVVCLIDDTVITVGSDTTLNSTYYTGFNFSVVALSDSKAIIIYNIADNSNGSSGKDNLYAMICSINLTTINIEKNIELISNGSATTNMYPLKVLFLQNNRIAIICSRNTYLTLIFCSTNNENVEILNQIKLSEVDYSAVNLSALLLDSGRFFTAHSVSGVLWGNLCDIDEKTYISKLEQASDRIIGVAQKKGTIGEIIPVIVPNFNIKEEN